MGKGYRAMSASYVVLSTPHSRWIMTDSTGSARGGPGGRRVDRPRGTRAHGPPRLGSTRAREVRIRRGGNGSLHPPPPGTPAWSGPISGAHPLNQLLAEAHVPPHPQRQKQPNGQGPVNGSHTP